MKLADFVAVVFGMVVFAAGTIILFGKLSSGAFGPFYLLFISILLGIIIYMNHHLLDMEDLAFVIIVTAAFAVGFTLFMSSLRSYDEERHTYAAITENLTFELDDAQVKTQYYATYTEYMATQIGLYQNNSKEITLEIASAREQLDYIKTHPIVVEVIEEVLVEVPAEPVPEVVYEEPEYYYEEEEEDDD